MKFSFIYLFVIFSVEVKAQTIPGSQLPKAVTATFIQKFPEVRREVWRKKGATEYKAGFIMNDTKMSTLINAQGDVLKTETEKSEAIRQFYLWLQTPNNEVKQRISMVDIKSPNIIAIINKSQ